MEIASRSHGGRRKIVLRTDNQNVLSLVDRDRLRSTVVWRMLPALNLIFFRYKVDVSPVYFRSERNLFEDGLAPWSRREIGDWSSQGGATRIEATPQSWEGMALPYGPIVGIGHHTNTFSILGNALNPPPRSYNYRVCEWRPSHYAVSGVLGNWAYPLSVITYSMYGVRDLLVSRPSRPLSVIGGKDIFTFMGFCDEWGAIHDFRRTSSQRSSRYDAIIVPFLFSRRGGFCTMEITDVNRYRLKGRSLGIVLGGILRRRYYAPPVLYGPFQRGDPHMTGLLSLGRTCI